MRNVTLSPDERTVVRTIRVNGDRLGPTELPIMTGLNHAVKVADGLVDRELLRVKGGEHRTTDQARRAI